MKRKLCEKKKELDNWCPICETLGFGHCSTQDSMIIALRVNLAKPCKTVT